MKLPSKLLRDSTPKSHFEAPRRRLGGTNLSFWSKAIESIHLARLTRALGKTVIGKFLLKIAKLLHSLKIVNWLLKILGRILFPLRNLSPKKRRALTGIALIIIVVAIPLSIYILKHAGVTQAAWFDEKFGFRQRVDITNAGSAQTNYQVVITLNTSTLITADKMQSDCDDIRIVDLTGKLLPFWTETGGSNGCNTTTTKIWTKVPSIPTSGKTVYIYYGNPSATVKSDISWMPTGGTITLLSDGHRVHKFTTSGTFTTTANLYVETLVVAGGGGGGMDMGGGGGGGGVISNTAYTVTASPITVTVGEGGAGAPAAGTGGQPSGHQYTISASNGQNSVFGTQTAIGGGKGGSSYWGYTPDFGYGGTGGSGGGSSGYKQGVGSADRAGAGTAGQGNRGGQSSDNYYSGGGGGAGAAGADAPSQANGGIGVANSILGTSYYWGGGGGGAAYSASTGGNGGNGGGGGGALGTTTGGSGLNSGSAGGGGACCSWANTPGGNAGANTGGGGGGGSHYNATNKGGDGGLGIVVARYPSVGDPVTLASPTSEENGPGPVGYWKFDEGTGTTVSDSIGKYNGSISGATWQTNDQCINGKCLKFNGTGDYVNVHNVPDSIFGGNFTVSAWVKFNTVNKGTDNAIFGHGTTVADKGLHLAERSGKAYMGFYGDDLAGNTTLSANTWYFVTFVYDGGKKIYVNGVLDNSGTSNPYTGTGSNAEIGRYPWATGHLFKGSIDEPKIYKYARSAAQVKADYNSRGGSGGNVLGAEDNKALSQGLVGYWKMDESSGNGCTGGINDNCDSSGNGNDGAWNGNTTSTTGKFGNGTTYDGADDYISVTNSTMVDGTNFTLSVWVKQNQSGYGQVMGWHNGGTDGALAFDINGSNPSLHYDTNTGGNHAQNYTGITISANTWHHYLLTKNGTNLKVYLDGAEIINETDIAADLNVEGFNFKIGDENNLAADYNGQMDEVRVYNRALSPAEASQLYNFAPGPQVYYNFEEGSGTATVNDTSGNANTGSINGTVTGANWVTGKFGKAYDFNGTDEFIKTPGLSFIGSSTSEFTVSGWINPRATSGTIFHSYYPSSGWSTGLVGFTGGKLSFYIHALGFVTETGTTPLNSWTYVTLTRDASNNNKLYKNGVLVASNNGAYSASGGANEIGIGRYRNDCCQFDSPGWFNGKMDEVQIYNYARSAKQIVSDMNAGHPAPGSPVGSALLHLKFDDGYGGSARNSGNSGAVLNGTITNATWTNDGKFNKALVFSNSNAFATVTDSTNGPLDVGHPTLTISAWINPRVLTSGETYAIVNKNGPYLLWIDGTNKRLYTGILIGGVWYWAYSANNSLVAGQWQYVAMTYDGTYRKLYVNGVQSGATDTQITGEVTDTNGAVTIGYDNCCARFYFDGLMDEIKIYSSALTDSEIKLDYNRGSSQVLGSLSDTSLLAGGSVASNSASAEYCVPGASDTCSAPIGRWDFEEGQGSTANDTSGHGYTGTLTGSPTWTQGKYGKGVNFISNDYMDLASPYLDLASNWTIESWFKYPFPSAACNTLTRGNGGDHQVIIDCGGTLLGTYDNVGGTAFHSSGFNTNTLSTGWHHLAAVGTGGNTLFYIDGKYVGTANFQSTSDIKAIGNYQGGTQAFGTIDQTRVFNYVRTPAQIAWDYNRGAPVGHWKMDECQGATANDSSGNRNSGTITIGATGTQTSVGTCTTASTAWGNGASGKFNYSMNFDGTDDYVSAGNGSSLNLGSADFTASAWIYPTSSSKKFFLQRSDLNDGWLIGVNCSSNTICLEVRENGTTSSGEINYSTTIQTNTWYHITVVKIGANITVYKNGLLVGTQTAYQNLSNSSVNFKIGLVDWWGPGYFQGKIDDVRVYNYALTKQQIQQVMNQGAGVRFGPSTGTP